MQCHPISTKHDNPKTRQYHQMSINQTSDSQADNDFGRENEKKSIFTPEQKQRIDQNTKKIKQFVAKLGRGRARKIIAPILVAYDTSIKTATALHERAKTREEKKMADAYMNTANGLIENTIKRFGKSDIEKLTEEDVEKLKEDWKKTLEGYKEIIKKKGKKCREYAIYRAIYDYLKFAEDSAESSSSSTSYPRLRTRTSSASTTKPNKKKISRKQYDMLTDEQKKRFDELGFTVVD